MGEGKYFRKLSSLSCEMYKINYITPSDIIIEEEREWVVVLFCVGNMIAGHLLGKTNFYIHLVVALDLAGKDTTYRSDNIKFELTVSPKKKCGKERDRLFSL